MGPDAKSMGNNGGEESEVRRGPWTIEEDTLLIHYIARHGEGQWNILAKQAGLKRTGKSCRLRWLNYLKPDVKRGNLTLKEQLLILELHSKWGNRWSKIAQQLPGRTDNEIKNYWRTRVQKQARQLKIESNSKRFFDAVRHLWIRSTEEPSNSCHFSSSSSSASSLHNMNFLNSSETYSNLSSNPSLPILQPSSSNHGSENPSLVQNSDSYRWPAVSEQPASPSGEFGNSLQRTQQPNDDFHVETRSYDPFSAMGTWDIADFDCQMAASDWPMEDCMVQNLWNLDV